MRRIFLHIITAIILWATNTIYTIAANTLPVWSESFEYSTLTTLGWTQESLLGSALWTIEDQSAGYPGQTSDGTKRVALRNQTGQTQGYITRLISPIIDSSMMYQPQLIFDYAQPAYAGDFDTLRVYTRTSASAPWVLAREYDHAVATWTSDTIDIANSYKDFQMMFEGKDNMGRGIAIDNIRIRSVSTCTPPETIIIDDLSSDAVAAHWIGSLNSDGFRVIITERDTEHPELLDSEIAVDTITEDFAFASGRVLEYGTNYNLYVRAVCQDESSTWKKISFTTRSQADLPFVDDFNSTICYDANILPKHWTCANINMGSPANLMSPFINCTTPLNERYRYASDSTSCLAFAWGNVYTSIPAGSIAYAATPELNVSTLKEVQLRFRGTTYNTSSYISANKVIVGVMNSPVDYNTFTPVDTIDFGMANTYKTHIVNFDRYDGNGKFIAFVSDFENLENRFFIDHVEVAQRPDVIQPDRIHIANMDATNMTIDADMHDAPFCNIRITAAPMSEPTGLDNGGELLYTAKQISIPHQIPLTNLQGRWVDIRMQGFDGNKLSEWSDPLHILVASAMDSLPLICDFEPDEYSKIYTAADLDSTIAHLSNTDLHARRMPYEIVVSTPLHPTQMTSMLNSGRVMSGSYSVELKGIGQYLVLPRLPEKADHRKLMMSFCLSEAQSNYQGMARVAVGIMDNPYDQRTFTPVATFESNNIEDIIKCQVAFDTYNGTGRYIAIMAVEAKQPMIDGMYYGSWSRIDQIYIDNFECMPATQISVEPQGNEATIRWRNNGADGWRIRVSADNAFDEIIKDTIVQQPDIAVRVDGLLPLTKYYYDITTRCDHISQPTETGFFHTQCGRLGTPYFEGFENIQSGHLKSQNTTPNCWDFIRINIGESYFPYICQDVWENFANNGTESLVFGHANAYTLPVSGKMAAILPKFMTDTRSLEFSAWIRGNGYYSGLDTLFVGTLTDPTDINTFNAIDSIVVNSSKYKKIYVSLAKATGADERIALVKHEHIGDKQDIFVDDVQVSIRPISNRIQNVRATRISQHGAIIHWSSDGATRYQIILSTHDIAPDSSAFTPSYIAFDTIVNQHPANIQTQQIETGTTYYVYIRSISSTGNFGPWSSPCKIVTACDALQIPYYTSFETEPTGSLNANTPDCWYTEHIDIDGHHYPYIMNNTFWAKSGKNVFAFCRPQYNPDDALYGIALPEFDADIRTLRLKFYVRNYSSNLNDELYVGVVGDKEDMSTFTLVDTVVVNSSAFQKAVVDFRDYQGSGRYIMLAKKATPNGSRMFLIDDVTVEYAPACEDITAIHFSDIRENGVTIATNRTKAAQCQYLIYESSQGDNFNGPEEADDVPLIDTITTSKALSILSNQLRPNTTYYVYARSVCNEWARGYWTEKPFSFTTPCGVISPQALGTVDFNNENDLNCWTTGIVSGSNAKPTISHDALHFYENTTTSGSYAIMPPLDIDSIRKYQVSFNLYANENLSGITNRLNVGVITRREDPSTFSSQRIIVAPATAATDAPRYTVRFDQYAGDYNDEYGKQIMFFTESGDSILDLYIDNVRIDTINACIEPSIITTRQASDGSVAISWEDVAPSYRLQITRHPQVNQEIVMDTLLYTHQAEIRDLPSGTYYVFIQSLCDDYSISRWSNWSEIGVECAVGRMLPYNETFDSNTMLVNQMPDCWSAFYGEESMGAYPRLVQNGYYASSGDISVCFYAPSKGVDAIAVLPRINTTLKDATLRFSWA
ncbi:MAG: hypothetical protein IJ680_02795, partial [Paludibacteraceae bacterium]|nr:hypothetical protein [Paludibacteraceae bacterium]